MNIFRTTKGIESHDPFSAETKQGDAPTSCFSMHVISTCWLCGMFRAVVFLSLCILLVIWLLEMSIIIVLKYH